MPLQQRAGAAVYNFLFAHETRYKGGLLSTHADELAFVFHNVEYIGSQFAGPQTARMETEIFDSFMAFVRRGDPNNAAIPVWKPVTEAEHNCFVFSSAPGTRTAHDEELMRLVTKYGKNNTFAFLEKKRAPKGDTQ